MMLKRFLLYISVVLFVTSCYEFNKPEKPNDLISKEKMVNILIDIKLLSNANGENKQVLKDHKINSEAYIYNKYGIDSLQFALSNNYYAYHIDDYEAIYTKMKDSLDGLRKHFDDLVIKEVRGQKIKDSIQRIRVKDSIKAIIIKDSLYVIKRADSIKAKLTKKVEEKGGLINPVSDK